MPTDAMQVDVLCTPDHMSGVVVLPDMCIEPDQRKLLLLQRECRNDPLANARELPTVGGSHTGGGMDGLRARDLPGDVS